MTRKDYKLLAEAIKHVVNVFDRSQERTAIIAVVDALGIVLKRDNPNFNSSTFIDACGLGEIK